MLRANPAHAFAAQRSAATRLVATHSDFHLGNVLREQTSGRLRVVDLQMLSFGVRHAAATDYALFSTDWRMREGCLVSEEAAAAAREAFGAAYLAAVPELRLPHHAVNDSRPPDSGHALAEFKRSLELYEMLWAVKYLKGRACSFRDRVHSPHGWGWGASAWNASDSKQDSHDAHGKWNLSPAAAFSWLIAARRRLTPLQGIGRPGSISARRQHPFFNVHLHRRCW